MVQTRPSRSPEELLELLDLLEESDEFDGTADELARISAQTMLELHGAKVRLIRARFAGNLPARHAIGVRAATRVLGEMQEALSEMGAVTLNNVPARGPLPAEVLKATELQLSPQVSPGSVVFTLQPAVDEVGLWARSSDEPVILDVVLGQLFEVFDSIERPTTNGTTPETVSDRLREFGPRTARHLLLFAKGLEAEGLSLDLGWTRSGQPTRRSGLSPAGAGFLGAIADRARTREQSVVLRGSVRALSTENHHKFKDDERGVIEITTSEALTDQLHPTFKHGVVEIDAIETETVNAVTGKSKRTYVAIEVRDAENVED